MMCKKSFAFGPFSKTAKDTFGMAHRTDCAVTTVTVCKPLGTTS